MTGNFFVPVAEGVLVDFPFLDFVIEFSLQVNDGGSELLHPARYSSIGSHFAEPLTHESYSLAVQRQPLGVRHLGAVLPPLFLQHALVVEHLVLQLDLALRVLHVERHVVDLGHDVGEGVPQPQRPPLHLLAARAEALDLLLERLHSAKVKFVRINAINVTEVV